MGGEARAQLVERFALSETQAVAILELQLQRLTGLERQKILDELAEIEATIARLKKILGSRGEIDEIVVSELKALKDFKKIILMVGNTQGVGQVDDRLVVGKPEPEAVMYTVRRGDTLSKIAKEHYGDARKYPVIFEANRPMLTHPDKIYPGQMLRIPPL